MAKLVTYHGNDGPTAALVADEKGDNVVDLIVFDPKTGASSWERGVPQRDKGAAAGRNWEPR